MLPEEVTGNVAMSCRYFGISRQAYYSWYHRYRAEAASRSSEDHRWKRYEKQLPGHACRST
ncbi:hypothetical protein [Streptomyces sp. S.PB5]|uniref:hypothetical protein n=1 Tax=Streptomyces sp. S.PB5 TaxID=3020844 RepID=UPI0025B1D72B|nr:hypothetical protein [Streptomyces sp. S.PB5]MDN3029331.1 hypothetical protein [Streptomyces sp. S.PB5]